MDPVSLYLADIYTVTANIVGCPAMSVPIGTIDEKNAQGEIEKLPV
jgi:aspartyl-tRNA(Asn)/glutamyl-tRNA(Gln) amidotransferase subunit A